MTAHILDYADIIILACTVLAVVWIGGWLTRGAHEMFDD